MALTFVMVLVLGTVVPVDCNKQIVVVVLAVDHVHVDWDYGYVVGRIHLLLPFENENFVFVLVRVKVLVPDNCNRVETLVLPLEYDDDNWKEGMA